MKNYILGFLVVFLFLGYTTFAAEIKPGQIIVDVVVINDGAGELEPSNLKYNVMYGEATASSFGWNSASSTTFTLDQGNLERPMLYEVFISRNSNEENRNVYGIYNGEEWQKVANLYKPYWPSGGGVTTFTGDCIGTINPEEVKRCTITFNDGDIKYGWGYTETSPGFYNEEMRPLTTACTYKNRGQFYGNKLVKAPAPSPEDNIIGCLTMKTEAEYKAEAEATAKSTKSTPLLQSTSEEISNTNSESVQPSLPQQQIQLQPLLNTASTTPTAETEQTSNTNTKNLTNITDSNTNIANSTTAVDRNFSSTSMVKDAKNIGKRLAGKIILQVESHGEAYYVNPKDSKKYYMANGDEAYKIMRNLGVGITDNNLEKIKINKTFAKKNSGKIFLQVQSNGEAYYIDFNGVPHYLKNGDAAYNVMRDLGLGITNNDLNKIPKGNL